MVRIKYFDKPYFLAAIICIFVFYSGLFSFQERKPFSSLLNPPSVCKIQGKILNSPVRISNKKYYSCKVKVFSAEDFKGIKSSAYGNVTVFIPSEMAEAFYPGKLYSISKNRTDGFFESGGNFSLKGRMRNGIFYVEYAKALGYDHTFFGKILFLRARCRLAFKKLMYSWKDAGGFLLALMSGSREYTEDCIKESFKNAGLSHILALSGMHLSLFSGIALFIGKKSGRKKISFSVRIAFLIFFVWFAGFSPSLLRAFICSMLVTLSSAVTKEPLDMILLLSFSFLLQSIISPDDIHNSGFILSYTALAGILLFNRGIRKMTDRFLCGIVSSSISSSLSAQIFTAPISLKLFGTFCPVGIIATGIISPAVTFFIYSGLFLIVLSLIFPGLSSASGIFLDLQYNVIKALANFFAKAPFFSMK